jgi:hypothetical protein
MVMPTKFQQHVLDALPADEGHITEYLMGVLQRPRNQVGGALANSLKSLYEAGLAYRDDKSGGIWRKCDKTLEMAIGCWTVNPDSFEHKITLIRQSATTCKRFTIGNQPPSRLKEELILLQRRIEALTEVVASAVTRCDEIINTGEVR